jgi:hypothetical protein
LEVTAHRTSSGGQGSVLLLCWLVLCWLGLCWLGLGCGGGNAQSAKSSEEPNEALATEPQAQPEPERVHACGQDTDQEEPIASGSLGEGPRVVRLINNSGAEIQARLLDTKLSPVIDGTLRVPEGTVGEFHVRAGVYFVRYRHRKTCEVRRGQPLQLTGPRAGVEISIRPHFEKGGKSKMQRVEEPL